MVDGVGQGGELDDIGRVLVSRFDGLKGIAHTGFLPKRNCVEAARENSFEGDWAAKFGSARCGSIDRFDFARFGKRSRQVACDSEDGIGDRALAFLSVCERRDNVFAAEEIGDLFVVAAEIDLELREDSVDGGRSRLLCGGKTQGDREINQQDDLG